MKALAPSRASVRPLGSEDLFFHTRDGQEGDTALYCAELFLILQPRFLEKKLSLHCLRSPEDSARQEPGVRFMAGNK